MGVYGRTLVKLKSLAVCKILFILEIGKKWRELKQFKKKAWIAGEKDTGDKVWDGQKWPRIKGLKANNFTLDYIAMILHK